MGWGFTAGDQQHSEDTGNAERGQSHVLRVSFIILIMLFRGISSKKKVPVGVKLNPIATRPDPNSYLL